jgi:hypothetical protein
MTGVETVLRVVQSWDDWAHVIVPYKGRRGGRGRSVPGHPAALLRWRDERRKIAAEPINTHHLDRKAENVEDHLDKVPVPRRPARGRRPLNPDPPTW